MKKSPLPRAFFFRSRGFLLALFCAVLPLAHAEESPLALSFIETNDARIVYFDPTLTYLAPHALRTYTNALAWQRRVLGWRPWDRTTVLLKDFSDYGNASASPLPRNTLRFDIAPVSYAFETYGATERMYSIMNHELTHVATTDTWAAQEAWWRRVFGGKVFPQAAHPETLLWSYLTVPRFTVPRWYAEGSAVFLETWMDGGLGRAQSGFYEMVFRAMVRDGAPFYDALGLESRGTRVDFQVGANAYLYGTRFFTWLAHRHSPQKVLEWLRRDDTGRRHYADQFEHVFGMPIERAWSEWIDFERRFQAENLERVRKHPITPYKQLATTAAGSISRVFHDEAKGRLYAGFDYQGTVAHIGALSLADDKLTNLADLKDTLLYKVTSLAWDPKARTLFYATDNRAFRDVFSLDVDTGQKRLLLKDARIGELVFNPADRSLLGIRHQNGLASLVRIPHPYQEWNLVHTFDYGVVPYDLDVSADGRLFSASVAEVSGEQFLRVWDVASLRAGEVKPRSEFAFGTSVPESFVFSPDGRHLYGSSYYTGVSNIFRYEVATGKIEAVSNAESGFFRPVPLADGRLVVFHYTAAGFVPAIIEPKVLADVSAITFLGALVAEKHPIVKEWTIPPPATSDAEKQVTRSGAYVPLRNLGFQSAYPVLQGYKEYAGLGYHVHIDDPLTLATIGITAAYTPTSSLDSDERFHADVLYRYLGWHAELSWNKSDFYDLFGPTIRSRRGFAAKAGYDHALVYDEPRRLDVKSEVAYYHNLDALPASQNIRATAQRLVTAEVGLFFSDVARSRGAVDDEKGIEASAVVMGNYADSNATPQLRGTLDFGFQLPWGHSSIWLRNAGGIARGEANDPYANFFLGGFGNNYVDSRNEKRYREHYAFPGFELNEIAGLRYSRHMLEANLPPLVFESLGTPALHLTWLRPAAFASVLYADSRNAPTRRFANIGAQVDLNFSVLHWYQMTLSFGYATGYRESKRAGDEWMVSLKVM